MWQDWVFTVGSIIFIVALIPSFKRPPAPATGLVTGLVLLAYSVTQASLNLWFAFGTTLILALCWFALAWKGAGWSRHIAPHVEAATASPFAPLPDLSFESKQKEGIGSMFV